MKGLFALVQAALVAVATAAAAHNAAAEECAGYNASDVRMYTHGGTADLRLAGKACNASGHDLEPLKLIVSYDTAKRLHVQVLDADRQAHQIPVVLYLVPALGRRGPSLLGPPLRRPRLPFSFDELLRRNRTSAIPLFRPPRVRFAGSAPAHRAEPVRASASTQHATPDDDGRAYAWTTGKAADQNGQTTLIPFSFKDGVLTTNDTFGYVTKSSICKVLVLGGDNKGSAANAKTSSSVEIKQQLSGAFKRDAAKLLGEI